MLAEEIRAHGVDAKAVIYPKTGHKLGRPSEIEERSFLIERLRPTP